LTSQRRAVPLRDQGLDGHAPRRRRRDDGQVADARHRHVEGPRNRRGGQRQQVHLGPQLLEPLLLLHAEALLFVDDDQPQLPESHVSLDQAVGADDDVDAALLEPLEHGIHFAAGAEPRQQLDPHGPVREPVGERRKMLLCQQCRGYQQGDLPAGLHGDEGGPQGNFGLAEADVTAHDAVHRHRRLEIGQHRLDGGLLVRCLFVRKARGEFGAELLVDGKGKALAGQPAGIEVEQLGGNVAHLLGRLAPRFLPLAAAQPV
jgi:hypothetical protein